MNNPLVSILILAYNQEEYLADCLDAALAQEGDFDLELVLAEDASSDATLQICQDYQRRYPDKIVLLSNQHNKGVVQNYFDALRQCRGEFIADCGGDDYWPDPLRLQKQVELLLGNPALSMVYGQWKSLKQSGLQDKTNDESPIPNAAPEASKAKPQAAYEKQDRTAQASTPPHYDPADYGPQTAARFLNRQYKPEIVLSTAMYRKSMVLEALEQNPELFLHTDYRTEDIAILTTLLLRGPAYYLPECFLIYRVLDDSVSHASNEDKYYRFAYASFKQSLDWARHIGLQLNEILPYLQSRYKNYLHYAFRAGNPALAVALRRAVKEYAYRPSFKNECKYYLTRCSLNKKSAL